VFQDIAAILNWNPSASRNALQIGLSEELKDFFTYRSMPKENPVFMTVSQMREEQIRQRWAEKAAQIRVGTLGFYSSKDIPWVKTPRTASVGTVAGYPGPALMDLGTSRRRISAEERAHSFPDGRGLYCGGFNLRADEGFGKKQRSDDWGSWRRGKWSRNKGWFQGRGKILGEPKSDGSVVDGKSLFQIV